MKPFIIGLLSLSLISCTASSTQPHKITPSSPSGITQFVIGNLCDTDVSFRLTTLKRYSTPSINFGITPDKMLGFSVISKQSAHSVIETYSLKPFQKVTIKHIPSEDLPRNPFGWFKKFRITQKSGYLMQDPHDVTQWLRANRDGNAIYTFFVCKL